MTDTHKEQFPFISKSSPGAPLKFMLGESPIDPYKTKVVFHEQCYNTDNQNVSRYETLNHVVVLYVSSTDYNRAKNYQPPPPGHVHDLDHMHEITYDKADVIDEANEVYGVISYKMGTEGLILPADEHSVERAA